MTSSLPHDLSPQLQYAMYMPAISPGYGEMAIKDREAVRTMPAGLEPKDLNFLSPTSGLFYLPAALYSAGIVQDLRSPAPTMISQRNRKASHALADSGGYQVARGKIEITSVFHRKELFDWQAKHCDFGITLDVPTKALEHEESGYTTFEECLADTVRNLMDYRDFAQKTPFSLLNVLQGSTGEEADTWYETVKMFTFNGWAIAGPLKNNMYEVVRRVLTLIDDGRINERENWLHFLGEGRFKIAVLLTVLRDCLREYTGDSGIHISMDTSSPGQAAGRYRKIYTGYNFTDRKFNITSTGIPFNNAKYLGSDQPFPHPISPIGQALTMGDLIVLEEEHMDSRLDMLSACMLMNHNIYVYSRAIMEANEELQKHRSQTLSTVPAQIYEAKCAIEDIFAATDKWKELEKRQRVLERV